MFRKKVSRFGNTPTGVGKTTKSTAGGNNAWKHPHGRGEDHIARAKADGLSETPPRAWGRLLLQVVKIGEF